MPRESAASLAIVRQLEPIKRPEPPADLTDEQAVEWREITDRMAPDWFPRETFPLLSAYCKHIVTLKHVGQLIQAEQSSREFDLDRYDQLLRMQERESRAMSSLATRMRLSQQSTYDESKKKPKQISQNPWDKSSGRN